jgi:chromate reductase
MSDTLRVAAISGSLRKASYNTAALRAAQELAPEGMAIEIHLLHEIPLYNEEIDGEAAPEPVRRLREAVAAADGVLLAAPEYNYAMSGVLKNALDWLSRPPLKGAIFRKPMASLGASLGMGGTARAQETLRNFAAFNQNRLLPHAEVLIAQAKDRFDGEGRLTHEPTRQFLAGMLAAYADWIRLTGAR